jgi:hypothetical protein
VRVGAAAASRRVWVTAAGGVRKWVAVGLLERIWKGGVERHVRLVLSQVTELSEEAVLGIILAVSWNQHRRKNGALYSLVVVGVDADLLLLGTERKLTALQWLQFMVALKVGPAPHPAVNDMGQSLPVGHLQPAVQRAGNGDTVTRLPRAAQRLLQLLHSPFLFLQFFHQSINSFLCPFFFFVTLLPPKKSLHCWTCEGKQACHIHSDDSSLQSSSGVAQEAPDTKGQKRSQLFT